MLFLICSFFIPFFSHGLFSHFLLTNARCLIAICSQAAQYQLRIARLAMFHSELFFPLSVFYLPPVRFASNAFLYIFLRFSLSIAISFVYLRFVIILGNFICMAIAITNCDWSTHCQIISVLPSNFVSLSYGSKWRR